MKNRVRVAVCISAWVLMAAGAFAQPYAYIGNNGQTTISVIDLSTNTVVDTITAVDGSLGVAVNSDGSRAYVTHGDFLPVVNEVSVIDTSLNTVIASIPIGGWPQRPAISPDDGHLYVPENTNGTVQVVSTSSNSVVAAPFVGGFPRGAAVHPDGSKYYVSTDLGGRVAVLSADTNAEIGSIPAGIGSSGMVFSPDGSTLYVTDARAGQIYVVDTGTDTAISTIFTGGAGACDLTISPDGSTLYAADDFGTHQVWVIDTASETVIASPSLGLGNSPTGIDITSDGTSVYIAGGISNLVHVMDTATNSITDSIAVGVNAAALGEFITPSESPPPELTLTVEGVCPGLQTISIAGATPGGAVQFWGAESEGTFTVVGGACDGTVVGLDTPQRLLVSTATGDGTLIVFRNVQGGFCGKYLQVGDGESCRTSNTAQIDE